MDGLKLQKAILHILDNNHEAPIFSSKELSLERDVCEFLEKHIHKVLLDENLKNAYFPPSQNLVFNLCKQLSQNKDAFYEVSVELTNALFTIMKENPSIPAADVVFGIFESDAEKYLALIKFNYKNSYIHYVMDSEEGNVNSLIRQKTTLPGETQKVEECVLVNLHNLDLKILEKQYEINAHKEFYLSKYFLKCDTELSTAQKIKILDKTVNKLSKKHFNEDFEKSAQLRNCLVESIAENNEIKVERVAEAVFGKHADVKNEYVEEIKKAGVVEETIALSENDTVIKRFSTQKLKTDSGIEINFPSHFYNNKDFIEFINNPDGTISILIKNVSKVINK